MGDVEKREDIQGFDMKEALDATITVTVTYEDGSTVQAGRLTYSQFMRFASITTMQGRNAVEMKCEFHWGDSE